VSNKTCALCGHFKVKEYPEHAKVGIGRCASRAGARADQIAPFLPWKTPACERFVPAPNVAERLAWVEKKQPKNEKG